MSQNPHVRILFAFLVIILSSCQKEAPVVPITPSIPVSLSENLLLGNPSQAQSDTNYSTNYLLENKQYALSYDRNKGIPNWVSWHLAPNWLGNSDRQDDFRPDSRLPLSWYRVKPTDFTASGFDRGHLCPSADRTNSVEDNSATFLMSNMMPQTPNNNRITWENLESYARKLVSQGKEIYVIAGPLGAGGTGSNGGLTYSIANGKITVPAYTWKVLLVLEQGNDDLSRITTNTRVIAVKMPNTQSVNEHPWEYYRISVDELEMLTDYDFLSSLPVNIQTNLESQVDSQIIR